MDLNMRTEDERKWAVQGFNEMADYYDKDCECRMSIAFDGDKPIRRILVNTPMDAAFYTMIDIIAGGISALDGHTLDFCSSCGGQFIKHRSNATLCPACRTPYAKVKASRNRKKEALKNVHKER